MFQAQSSSRVGNPNAGLPFQSAANFALSQDVVDFVIQILHAAGQEGGVAAIDDAPRFSAVVNGWQADPNFPNTISKRLFDKRFENTWPDLC
ncbi:MAG: hypothetical protein AAGB13_04115 [Cyanobacteria bacterium P01_F01_bin.33]